MSYINAIIEANFQKLKHNRLLQGMDVQISLCLYNMCLFEESIIIIPCLCAQRVGLKLGRDLYSYAQLSKLCKHKQDKSSKLGMGNLRRKKKKGRRGGR